MDLKEKYFEEIKLLKNERINRVIQAAKVEFSIHGIINSKIKDIAARAEVGEASVYRYFADKTAIAQVVAFDYWKDKSNMYLEHSDDVAFGSTCGLNQLLRFLEVFEELYLYHKDFLKFVEDFDNYLITSNTNGNTLNFAALIMSIKEDIYNFVKIGHLDKSIKESVSPNEIYSFVTQVMIPTSQKLAIRFGNLATEDDLDPIKVLENLISMFKCHIENKEK